MRATRTSSLQLNPPPCAGSQKLRLRSWNCDGVLGRRQVYQHPPYPPASRSKKVSQHSSLLVSLFFANVLPAFGRSHHANWSVVSTGSLVSVVNWPFLLRPWRLELGG